MCVACGGRKSRKENISQTKGVSATESILLKYI